MPRSSRSISSATLSLGLVAIPVGLHPTRRRAGRVSYHLVHAKDGSRVHRQWICDDEGVPVEEDELARSYEGEEGAVVLSKEEAKAAAPKSTGRIDLIEFVPADQIDPVYFDNAYYLSPKTGGERAYHLLADTLRDEREVGVGTQLARGKSYLVAVRATALGLVMHTLHHAEEVHAEKHVEHGAGGRVSESEKELARTLVHRLHRSKFDAAKFADDADEALRALIKSKEPARAAEEAPKGKMVDLMESLKASLAGRKPAKRASGPRGSARPSRGHSARSRKTAPRTRARAR